MVLDAYVEGKDEEGRTLGPKEGEKMNHYRYDLIMWMVQVKQYPLRVAQNFVDQLSIDQVKELLPGGDPSIYVAAYDEVKG